jgi:hypothetical protein
MGRAVEQVRLRACVAELCEIQRAVVTLRILEERPGEDVAQLLGITKNHAAVLLRRAKSSLRACMTAATGREETRAVRIEDGVDLNRSMRSDASRQPLADAPAVRALPRGGSDPAVAPRDHGVRRK